MARILGKQQSCESHGWFASGYNSKSREEIQKTLGWGSSPAPVRHTGAGAAAREPSTCYRALERESKNPSNV